MKPLSSIMLATLLLSSCGDASDSAIQSVYVADSSPNPPAVSNSPAPNRLAKLLTEQLDATNISVAIDQAEATHINCTMPDGRKRTWLLSVISHPEQARVYAAEVEKHRGKPSFEDPLELGAFWGHNGEPTLTVIARDNLVFTLATHQPMSFQELANAINDPAIGGKWRADAVKITPALAEHLRKTFP